MRMKKMIKNKAVKCMVLGVAGLALMGGTLAVGPKPVYAAETCTSSQITYKNNLYYPELAHEIYLGKTMGTVTREYDNTFEVQTGTDTLVYSFYQTGSIELKKYYGSSYMENVFDTEEEAQAFIDTNLVEDAKICIEEDYDEGDYIYNYYIEGKLPVYTLSVKTIPNAECKSFNLTATKTKIHAGETVMVSAVTDVEGEYCSNLTWECFYKDASKVSIVPDGNRCIVLTTEAVGTVMIKATAPNGAFSCIDIDILN